MTIGQIIGGVVGSVIGFWVGGPMGAYIGASIGMMIGGMVDPPKMKYDGPANKSIQQASYGVPIPIVYGEPKPITGNCIWLGNFQSFKQKQKSGKGGAVGGGGGVYYTYSWSVAFGLALNKCSLVQVLKDRVDYPIGTNGMLFYNGTQTAPNNHIQDVLTAEGKTRFPVWKGLTYIVLPNVDCGSSTALPQFTFRLKSLEKGEMFDSVGGVVPTEIVHDALMDDFYGLGKENIVADNVSWDATSAYNGSTDDMRLSCVIDQQRSILDFMSYIIGHHNGLISYQAGKIVYNQLSELMAQSSVLTDDMFVKKQGEPFLEITESGDHYNKVIATYSKPEGIIGVTYAADLADIDNNGIKELNITLDAITTYERANRIAQRYLNRYLSARKTVKGTLGIASYEGIAVGDVIRITSAQLAYDHLCVVSSLILNDDYTLTMEAFEDNPESYAVNSIGTDSAPPPSPNLYSAASAVTRVIAREVPAQYTATNKYFISYAQPVETQWAESVLYKSYESGANYNFVNRTTLSSITGVVSGVGSTNGVVYIQVTLDSSDSLEGATSLDSLLITPKLNLCGFVTAGGKDIFVRFEDATLISGNIWKLSNILFDIGGFPQYNISGTLAINDVFYLLSSIPYMENLGTEEINKTLYFKPASANFAGQEQVLGAVTAVSLATKGLAQIPLTPVNIAINSVGVTDTNAIVVGTGDISISWMSRNRQFIGMIDFERTDTSKDDIEFESFSVEIYQNDDTTLIRDNITANKTWTYTSAMQAADGNFTPLKIYVRQKNSAYISAYADTAITVTII